MATFPGTAGPDSPLVAAFDSMYGGDGNDTLLTSAPGFVILEGGGGDDALVSLNLAFVHAYGGDGNDFVMGSLLDDTLYGGEGNDLVAGAIVEPVGPSLRAEPAQDPTGNDRLSGDGGSDALYGFNGDDLLFGGDGDDSGATIVVRTTTVASGLYGGEGDDTLDGGPGSDLLVGGLGLDMLIGGTGADRFAFEASLESGKGQLADVIRDFSKSDGDLIDLSLIDANTKPNKPGDQAFKFSKSGFHDKAGEVTFQGGKVQVDMDGNGKADFHIKLIGIDSLGKDDFVL